MPIKEGNLHTLKYLEAALWRVETRFDQKFMDSILAPDFFEFGRSGKIYKREDILKIPAEKNIKATLQNFKIQQITAEVVLITYLSEVQYEDLEIANRSSLWLKTPDGWKLQFHQGTPVVNTL